MRNSFLAAALELRSGIPAGAAPKSTGPDMIRALSTLQFLDFLGIRLDSNADRDAAFVINLITPDNGEQFVDRAQQRHPDQPAGLHLPTTPTSR